MTRLLRQNTWLELGVSLLLTGFFLMAYLNMDSWVIEAMPATISPAFFPKMTAFLLFLFSLVLIGSSLWMLYRNMSDKNSGKTSSLQNEGKQTSERYLALGAYILVMFLYLIGLHYVGFLVSTPLVMLAVGLLLGIRCWMLGLVCYVLFTFALYFVSFQFMQIILPSGVLFS